MKKFLILLVLIPLLAGCRTPGVRYSKSLFQHIPDDPQLLVLVNPNDVSSLLELAVKELDFTEMFEGKFKFDPKNLDYYKGVAIEMMSALGIPVEKVESVGFVLYYNRPVFLLSGDFFKKDVTAKLTEIGFKQREDGIFDYVYDKQKLAIPADGLMMMAEQDLLEDMLSLPDDKRMWDREDFKEYRMTSPLDNSVFVWAHPPDDFLTEFAHREDLGDVSMAMKFGRTITLQAVARIKDPKKAVYLHDMILGVQTFAKGLFGSDQDYGPLFNAVKVTQDNSRVTVSLVVPAEKVLALKDRVRKDFLEGGSSTFDNLNKLFEKF